MTELPYRVLALGCVLLLFSCAPEPSPTAEIRIGFLPPAAGSWPAGNLSSRRAAELALEELEDRGGLIVDGTRHAVKLVERDIVVSPESALRGTRQL